jgi:hypothetical protein
MEENTQQTNEAPVQQQGQGQQGQAQGGLSDLDAVRSQYGINPKGQPQQKQETPKQQATPQEKTPVKAEGKPEAEELFELKINGKLQKLTKQQVLDYANRSYAAEQRFTEAKRMKEEADKVLATLKSGKDPLKALIEHGGFSKEQIRDAIEDFYNREFIEPTKLTEEQRRMKEYEEKLKSYEEKERLEAEKKKQEEEEQLTAREREHLQNQIIEALDSSGLPKTKYFASRMAFYMRQNLLNGWEAPVSAIVEQVKQERSQIMSDLTENASVEQLISLFGENVINKIRKHDLEQLRAKRSVSGPVGQASKAEPRQGGRPSWDEVQENLKKARLRGF